MLVLLSRDEPADAVRADGGVHDKASQEEHREQEQPVDALRQNAWQGPFPVFLCHSHIAFSFYPCLVKDEVFQGFQRSVCMIESSHRFSTLEKEDIWYSHSSKSS